VVYAAPAALAPKVGGLVTKAIKARLKLDVPVVIRTAAELKRVVANNPYLKRVRETEKLHVMFLADEPSAAAVKALDPRRSAPDEFIVRGREIYLHTPNGMGKSKLTNAWFDAQLKTISTARNWRTVQTLLAMAEGKPEPA
jgi:uncharacterized protein (DUF1697 family)